MRRKGLCVPGPGLQSVARDPPSRLSDTKVMAPYLPVEDRSESGSFVDRTVAYVRGSLVLRINLVATVAAHIAALLLVATDRMRGDVAGLLALLSLLTWFFAVCLPMMNREVRVRMGGSALSYWGEVVEMFGVVALCASTALYAAVLTAFLLHG